MAEPFEVKCPQWGEPQRCPCPACRKENAGKIVWIWGKNDTISCGNCELTLSHNRWLELADEQLHKWRHVQFRELVSKYAPNERKDSEEIA